MDNMNNNGNEKSKADVVFSLKRKYDNFWYYYKWHALIGVGIIFVLIFCISQCTGKKQGDANIAYVGGKDFAGTEFLTVCDDFNIILEADLNGDGETYVDFNTFFYMTALEIENARARGDIIDMQSLVTVKKQIDMEILNGDSVIYFLSADIYKEFSKTAGMFMTLEDALGYTPEGAVDEYCIRLSDLYCREYFEGIYHFPEDTVIAVRDYQTTSKKEDVEQQERYSRNFKMLKKLIDFEQPQELPEED